MTMSRILEFTPSQEEAVIARVLVLVHQAVDEHFPAAEGPGRQFTKTVFSDDGERTAIGRPEADGSDGRSAFGNEESTSPQGRAAQQGQADDDSAAHRTPPPPPPPRPQSPAAPAQVATPQPPPRPVPHAPRNAQLPSPAARAARNETPASPASAFSAVDTAQALRSATGADWTQRLIIALLIAGLVLLAYALFA